MARWYAKGREVMAKITANGAHEVTRISVRSPAGIRYIWVMCSDGRVLSKPANEPSLGYTVYQRGLPRKLRDRGGLLRLVLIRGYRAV